MRASVVPGGPGYLPLPPRRAVVFKWVGAGEIRRGRWTGGTTEVPPNCPTHRPVGGFARDLDPARARREPLGVGTQSSYGHKYIYENIYI